MVDWRLLVSVDRLAAAGVLPVLPGGPGLMNWGGAADVTEACIMRA